jgi:hypothetical protein
MLYINDLSIFVRGGGIKMSIHIRGGGGAGGYSFKMWIIECVVISAVEGWNIQFQDENIVYMRNRI